MQRYQSPEIREAVLFVGQLARRPSSEALEGGDKLTISAKPMADFYAGLYVCLAAELCDKNLAMDEFCLDAAKYIKAMQKVDPPSHFRTSPPPTNEESKQLARRLIVFDTLQNEPKGKFYRMCRDSDPTLDDYVFRGVGLTYGAIEQEKRT